MDSLMKPSQSMGSKRISLTPKAGFVVKSLTTTPGYYIYVPTDNDSSTASSSSKSSPNFLEPTKPPPKTLVIPKDMKVFINIAWDSGVPPPPPDVPESEIRRAMAGEDLGDGTQEGAYYVPSIISEPREDKDKSGKASLVFDCVYNTSLRSRATKDEQFRMYLVELALEHVEDKAQIILSRQIGTPNIASKGKLESRTVVIPNRLLNGSGSNGAAGAEPQPKRPLIEEIPTTSTSSTVNHAKIPEKEKGKEAEKPRSILKSSLSTVTATEKVKETVKKPPVQEVAVEPIAKGKVNGTENRTESVKFLSPPRWKWVKDEGRIMITMEVPKLTKSLYATSTLDIEARRILLTIPSTYHLDINLDLPDSKIGQVKPEDVIKSQSRSSEGGNEAGVVEAMRILGENVDEALRLKRERDFDVEKARAEWRVGEGKLILWV